MVIVGGGIGGLTAALALVRAGVHAKVIEQAAALAVAGASIDVGPNAVRLLDALGLGTQIREVGVRPDAIELVRWDDGRLLLRAPHGASGEDRFAAPVLDFLRSDLHRVLADALPSDALVLGTRVSGIGQDARSVRALLANGGTVEGDAIVAADGIRSRVRQCLMGSDEPMFSGTVVYRGVVPAARIAHVHPPGVNRYWLGPGRHAVAYWIAGGRLLAVNAAVSGGRRPRARIVDG